jgi:transposase
LIADADSTLPMPVRELLPQLVLEIGELETRGKAVEKQLKALAVQTPVVERLCSIPGIGLLSATALVGFVGDVARFPSGRHFAAYLGLTPREHSSGSRRRLGRISKQGDVYLRTLLIHGARSVLIRARSSADPDHFRKWGLELQKRCGHNKAAIAVANKLARMAWAVWKSGKPFESRSQTLS